MKTMNSVSAVFYFVGTSISYTVFCAFILYITTGVRVCGAVCAVVGLIDEVM